MCGIAGFVNFQGHDPAAAADAVKRMAATLRHRGPDAEGFFVDEYVAFGHRRLSIIDISRGQQPIAALGGRVQIMFNGEIYNYLDLRRELTAAGHNFSTNSDTEVILAGYLEWGERCIERLNGMFAIALWDARSKSLLLARDRVGKKPLYIARVGSRVGFASELKALRATGLCGDELDPQAVDCYFTLGYVPAPRTIFSAVRKLPAATVLTVTPDGERQRRYWTLSFAGTRERSLEEAVEEFKPLLDEAVRCRLMSEVPIGAFLSGGIDSSLVVESMSRLMSQPVITHSIGFEDRASSELPVAQAIATALGTNHHEYTVTPRAADVLGRIAWHFDEPVADSSALPTWYVCEMTRRSVTVALSGDGGDEGFGGYTFRYRPHMYEARIRAALPAAPREAVFGTLAAVWPGAARLPQPLRLKTIFGNLAVGDAEAFYRDLATLRPQTRDRLYTPEFAAQLKGFTPMDVVAPIYTGSDAANALGRSQFADVNVYMTDDVLVKVDRMSMAHSLEVRAPLLDHRVLEFAARLPVRLRVHGRTGKVLLRAMAARRLPRGVDRIPKRGFSIPAADWLRGELRDLAEDVLLDSSSPWQGHLEPAVVRGLWAEHQRGSRDHSSLMWGLMMFGLWRRALDPAGVAP